MEKGFFFGGGGGGYNRAGTWEYNRGDGGADTDQ